MMMIQPVIPFQPQYLDFFYMARFVHFLWQFYIDSGEVQRPTGNTLPARLMIREVTRIPRGMVTTER